MIGLGGGGPRRKGRTVRGRARGRGGGTGGPSRPVEGRADITPTVELGEPLVFPDEDP